MSRSPILIGLALSIGIALGSAPNASAQGTTIFHIDVPRKLPLGAFPTFPAGPMQIMKVRATVSVASDLPVTFTITDPQGNTWNPGPLTPGMAAVTHNFPPPVGSICASPSLDCFDSMIITPNSSPVGDPNRDRYSMYFSLNSDFEVNNSCRCTQDNPTHISTNTYTITVTAGPNITGVCLESFDGLVAQSCTASVSFVPITPSGVATAREFPAPTQGCFKERPGADVILVLDKSGSMASSTMGGTPQPKITALQGAVSDFVNVWNGLRSTEGVSAPQDNIGVTLFDAAANFWMVNGKTLDLKDFTTVNTDITNNVGTITPGSSTSIGGGLALATPKLVPNATRREVALLMSDGMQNKDPVVGIDPNNSKQVVTYNMATPNVTTALPNQPPLQIYAVTVGTGLAVSAAINQQLATASGGFYINTEDNSNLVKPFFLELLQNFLKFNTYETVRMISEKTPYSTTVPISTTSHDVEFNLMWPNQLGALRLTITPPGGAKPLVRESASGFIAVVQSLPLREPFNPLGTWGVVVEMAREGTTATAIPFDLHVMTDDAAIKTDLSVVPADYVPGDKIRLQAKLTQFGLPVSNVGSNPGDRIEVQLIRPGKSVGDILSDSTASSVSSGPDPQSPAEAKLSNTLRNDPSALVRNSDTVTLFDDGKPEHGDAVAGDGIYSALYPATLPGHYNFLFAVQGTAKSAGRFSRQQLKTVYVRSVPDAGNTVIQSSILRSHIGNVLSIVMTPRVKPGPGCLIIDPKCGRMGPGWANYFWFTAPGVTPFKAKDNLDGTYTATLAFAGSVPPTVSVHFENVLAVIGDSVPPDKLPVPLGQGNVLTVVPPPCCQAGQGRFALFLDAGAGIPHGTFSNAFNTGFSLNAGLEYILTSRFSAEGIFGYHHFPAKVGSAVDLYQFSGNGKFYLTSGGPFRPFMNAGIGGYDFTPGGGTHFGGNVGAGVLREFGPHWGLQASYNFHAVNTPGAATKFSTAQLGIRFVF